MFFAIISQSTADAHILKVFSGAKNLRMRSALPEVQEGKMKLTYAAVGAAVGVAVGLYMTSDQSDSEPEL